MCKESKKFRQKLNKNKATWQKRVKLKDSFLNTLRSKTGYMKRESQKDRTLS